MERIGIYRITEKITTGGMAEIFKAQTRAGKILAVKCILKEHPFYKEFIKMFIEEAKISLLLDHPNIIRVYDVGMTNDDIYFLAMEYIEGLDLWAILVNAKKNNLFIPVPMACLIAISVLKGLDYAHNKKDSYGKLLGIIHRDISPPNIFISYEGQVKILDFGIATIASKIYLENLESEFLKGRTSYMSPEQIESYELNKQTDIFSIGIILYEMLSLKKLFPAKDHTTTINAINKFESDDLELILADPNIIDKKTHKELLKILVKALVKDRKKRYETCKQFEDELTSFLNRFNFSCDLNKIKEFMKNFR
jgi:serine/threonine-protein kinase